MSAGTSERRLLITGIVGLSVLLGWLDIVLFPALAFFIGLTIYAVWRRQRNARHS